VWDELPGVIFYGCEESPGVIFYGCECDNRSPVSGGEEVRKCDI
jgi:hypothetical protein